MLSLLNSEVWNPGTCLSVPKRATCSPGCRPKFRGFKSPDTLFSTLSATFKRKDFQLKLVASCARPTPSPSSWLNIRCLFNSKDFRKGVGRRLHLFWLAVITEGFCAHLHKSLLNCWLCLPLPYLGLPNRVSHLTWTVFKRIMSKFSSTSIWGPDLKHWSQAEWCHHSL